MTYLAIIAASIIIGPLYALREWRLARRETLIQRVNRYSLREER